MTLPCRFFQDDWLFTVRLYLESHDRMITVTVYSFSRCFSFPGAVMWGRGSGFSLSRIFSHINMPFSSMEDLFIFKLSIYEVCLFFECYYWPSCLMHAFLKCTFFIFLKMALFSLAPIFTTPVASPDLLLYSSFHSPCWEK